MTREFELIRPLPRRLNGRLKQIYPQLAATRTIEVEDQTNMIIDDVNLNPSDRQKFQSLINKNLVFFTPEELTPPIQQGLGSLPEGSLLVFPKNGALPVRDSLDLGNRPSTTIKVKREPGNYRLGRIIQETEMMMDSIADLKPETIVVIDDVVGQGTTMTEIRLATQKAANQAFFWMAVCWMMQYPNKKVKSSSGLWSFNQVTTSILYSGANDRYTPLNSLSTWLYDQEKGQIVLAKYAKKYALNPPAFIDFINQLAKNR